MQAMDAADARPGYTCFSGPGSQSIGLGSYAPGVEGSDYPAGAGVKVLPGSKIVLEMHYNTLASGPEPDRTSVDFKVDSTVEKYAGCGEPCSTRPNRLPVDVTLDTLPELSSNRTPV